MEYKKLFLASTLCVSWILGLDVQADKVQGGHVLFFGGNGFMGADTVELFLRYGFEITIINRGSNYWDSKDRIFSRVHSINCDREKGLQSCTAFTNFLQEKDHFEAVVDFSAYHENQVKESANLMKGKVGVYIYISSDSVYDVCKFKSDNSPYREEDGVRPDDEGEKSTLSGYRYGNSKLLGEEELIAQRQSGGIPYVILRLPDVIGPRDVTHRWWVYQLWLKTSSKLQDHPVTIPEFLVGYGMSLVYAPDVAQAILDLVKKPEVRDEAFNLAWSEIMTLKDVLEDIAAELEIQNDVDIQVIPKEEGNDPIFLYPSGRRGPVNVEKAIQMFDWEPTPWKEAVRATVRFYEDAVADGKYKQQSDEVIQIAEHYIMRADENKTKLYKTLEDLYDIDLNHFFVNHDEL